MRSVAEQTFTDFEHVIVDGASKDHTLKVARDMGTAGLRILSEPDKGLYYAMNKGIDLARGEYLLFLNAGDTFFDCESLQRYADAIATTNTPDIIYADTVLVDETDNVLGPRHLSAPQQMTFGSYANGMLVCHQAFMVRTEMVRLFNLRYNTRWRYSADYEWCLRCIRSSTPDRCINLKCATIRYLQEGLTTRNHRASLIERYRIMCQYYGVLPTTIRHIGFALRNMRQRKVQDTGGN